MPSLPSLPSLPERHPGGRELSSYLDGDLGDRRHGRVARHVDACPTCARELAALRKIGAALASQEEVEPRPGWLPRVQERVAAGARPASTARVRHRLRLRLAGGIAAVAAGLVSVGLWLAPPPPAPVSFQDEVRQHLVQMSNPLSDQTSYVVEASYP
jgi:anti-sigma factor RsiW